MSDHSDASDDPDRVEASQSGSDRESEDSESGEDGGGLLDLEASETGSDSEENEEDEDEDGFSDASEEREQFFFPGFMRLPPELRQRVWEFFDPYLRTPQRVIPLSPQYPDLCAGATLEQLTAPARAMLATHQESRNIALRYYPDTFELSVPDDALIRYNKNNDIVYLDHHAWGNLGTPWFEGRVAYRLRDIKYLAIEQNTDDGMLNRGSDTFNGFDGLSVVFECALARDIGSSKELGFIRDPQAGSFYVKHEEEGEAGLIYHVEMIYGWLNAADDEDQAIFGDNMFSLFLNPSLEYEDTSRPRSWPKMRPMALFMSEAEVDRYDRIKERQSTDDDTEDSESSEEDDDDVNEYESDGIDDSPIDDEDPSDDEDDLVVHELDEDEHLMGEWGTLADDHEQLDNIVAGYGIGEPVNFSSIEPESPEPESNPAAVVIEDNSPQEISSRKHTGRRIVDSDDDDDEDEEPPSKPVRNVKRRRVAIPSDSEESDDESEATGKAAQDDESASDSSEGDEEDDESEEGSQAQKPISLAERLQLFRNDNPVPTSDEENGSDDEEFSQGAQYSDDEDESNDEEGSEMGAMLDMAEEGDEEGDYDEGY